MIPTQPIDPPFRTPVLPPPGPRSKLSILVVEDEPSICRAVAIGMTRAGYNPTTTTTGEGAMYHLRTQYFDLLVMDLRIPDMRGDVIYHLATSLQPQLRKQTLFVTGDVTEQAAELIEACACPLLMKPFDLRGLEKAIGEVAVAAGLEPMQQQPQLKLHVARA